MIEKQSLSDQSIISCLKADYGIEVAAITLLPLGADMNASVYKAQTYDQTSYFVKIKRGHHHDIGIEIVERLHDAGIKEIIPPVKTIFGGSTQQIEDFTLIVYPFVNGQDGFSINLTDNQWVKLGSALRRVHDIDVPPAIQNRVRREIYSPKWREAVRSLYVHIEAEPTGDEIASKLLKFMKENILAIRRLVDRAEQLGQKLQDQSHKLVLCHSDIHGGNVLLAGNDNIYIVDWDDPIMAPKERDLMFIGGGVANVWNKPHEEKLFYKGYGTTEVNSTILAYYRHERIVEDIAEYGQTLLLTTTGGENRSEILKHFIDMFEPRGVVDIAFSPSRETQKAAMAAIKIRKAQPGDAADLAQIFLESRRSAFYWKNKEELKLEDFDSQTSGEVIFLAENSDGKILGFVSVWEPDRFIHHLFITPDHQRSGIGKLLMQSLLSWLPLPWRLKCVAVNQGALAFYQNSGWREVGKGVAEDGEYLLLELIAMPNQQSSLLKKNNEACDS